MAGLNESEFNVATDDTLPAGFMPADAALKKQTIAAKKVKTTLLALPTAVGRFRGRGLMCFIKHFFRFRTFILAFKMQGEYLKALGLAVP